ncbi:MAG: hypothetical protein KME64_37970 [Scytonematopsis contorta HA4267-MV1]|jgi:hypothetical protein|nr:hypothetical protein [Scytonematopsis contorta HA4267-MV1]
MSTYNPNCNSKPCEFVIPIKLRVPVDIYPEVNIHPVHREQAKLPVYLQPDIFLTPEVLAMPQDCKCLPEKEHN